MGLPRRRSTLVLATLLAAACGGETLTPVNTDAGTDPNARCTRDEDCGPRQGCNVAIGVCFDKDQCGPDKPCADPLRICAEQPEGRRCVPRPCTTVAECDGTVCMNQDTAVCTAGECRCSAPCQGGCPGTQGCCIRTDTCQPLPERCMGMRCGLGEILSVTATGAWDPRDCAVTNEVCRCEALPPLTLGDVGLYSALAYDGDRPVISAYNLDYGDLMYGRVAEDGVTIAWSFVDGVPTSTRPADYRGSTAGPRGGNARNGPDVGLYTDLASGAGHVHIAYQDRDAQDLKYAVSTGSAWRIHTVEGAGDTGLYSSLALDARGRPRLAYLSARESIGMSNIRRSVLRLAVSATTTPTRPADWTFRELESLSLVPYGCREQCRLGEVCRASDLRCAVPDTNCPMSCGDNQACLAGRCSLVDPLPPFRDIPLARGLWPSVAVLADGAVLVAYHDRVDRNLKLARIAGPDPAVGAISTVVLDGDGVEETGLYVSLFATPSGEELHLAYMNATRRSLFYLNLDAGLRVVAREEVDFGFDPANGPDGLLLGADPALVVDASGVVRVAYQDATGGDLRYARRLPGGMWDRTTLRGAEQPYAGTFGFYTDQVLGPDRASALISTYRYFLSAAGGARNGLELVTPP